MICGALSTLNEDAFEDVNQNQSVQTNGSTGELILQQQILAPISESVESPTLSRSCDSFFPDDANQFENVNNNNNNDGSNNNDDYINNSSRNRHDETTVIIMHNFSPSNIDDTRF